MSPPWEEIYAAHYRRLVALVAVIADSSGEAEEAVQEAFVRALGFAGKRVEDPEAWLYRVAVNVVRSRWRKATAARRYADRLARHDVAPSPDLDQHAVLIAALRQLPFGQREALALHYMADLSIADIAVRIDVPVGTVKARLARGRDALRSILDTAGNLSFEGGRRA